MSSVTQTWLEDPASIRGILVEVTVKDLLGKYGTANTDVTLYLSNIGYTTSTADVSYLPYLTGSLQTTESLSIDGGLSMSFGDIEISNPNGELDSWLDSTQFIWVNRNIQVYLGDPRWTATNLADVRTVFEKIFDGVIADVDSAARETLNIKVRDKLERLNTPLTANTLGTYGTWASGQTNQDSIRPIVFGEVHNMSPLLIDPSLLEYMFTDTGGTTTTTTVTATSAVDNTITCLSTQNFVVGKAAVFNGTGVFGGVVAGTIYYIKTIPSSTTFTISSTVGGATFVLTTGSAVVGGSTTTQSQVTVVELPLPNTQLSLLLRTSNNSTFVNDSSPATKSVTNNNSVTSSALTPFTNTAGTWDTTTYPFGSVAFNGTNQYLNIAANSAFQFGTGTFTCESWVYVTDRGKSYTVFSNGIMNNMIEMGITAAGYPYAAFGVISGGKTSETGTLTLTAPTGFVMTSVLFGGYGAFTTSNGWWIPESTGSVATTTLAGATFESLCVGLSTATITSGNATWGDPALGTIKGLAANVTYGVLGPAVLSTGTWHHLAIVRSGTGTNQTVFYVNGVAASTKTVATDFSIAPPVYVGATTYGNSTPTLFYKGNITNLRILKGRAAYTAAFTPSTLPLTAISPNVSLLTLQNSSAIDNSAYSHVLTKNGTTQTFSNVITPDTTTYSISFNGSNNYITIPYNSAFDIANSTPFTFECWVLTSSTNTFVIANRNWPYGSSGATWAFYLENGVTPAMGIAGTGSATYEMGKSTLNGTLGTWNHYAWSRDSSNTFRIFVNGQQGLSRADSQGMVSASGNMYIGVSSNLSSPYANGYMSNMRFVVGAEIYTTAFTPSKVLSGTSTIFSTTTTTTTTTIPGTLDPNLMTATISIGTSSSAESVIEIRYNGLPAYTNPAIYGNNNTTRPSGAVINLDAGKFTLTSQPFGTVTASVQGIKKSVDLTTGTILEGVYTNNIAKIIALIATQYGDANNKLSASDLDLTNLLAFSTANIAPVGTVILDRTNVLNVCQLIAASAAAQLFFNRKGLLQLLQLGTPTSDAVIAISDNDILFHSLNVSARTDVVAATKIGYCKNYAVQSTIAGNVPARAITMYANEWYTSSILDATVKANYKIQSTPEQQDTCLITKTDADALALSINNYFKVPRTVYSFVGKSSLFSLKLGQAVTLTHNRFGLSNGKSGQVISLSPDWVAGTINVEVII